MTKQSGAGNSAYGSALMKAAEAFVPQSLRLFEDTLIVDFLPGLARFAIRRRWMRDRFMALLERGAPGIRGALLCRTRAIDDAVEAAIGRGLRVVVILGAGLDTRAYRLLSLAEAVVFEVDLPPVQAFKKRQLLRRLGALPPHVRFVPLDFNVERLDAGLAGGGLGPEERAIFIWEGVTQYLLPEAVDAVLRTIAARPKGSELVFTYVLEEVVTGRFHADRSEAFRKSATRRPAPWYFGIEPSQLGAFLGQRGLTLCEDRGAEEHVTRYVRPLERELVVSEIERVARASV
jgi:methyltransferase (TIGR00027 family)